MLRCYTQWRELAELCLLKWTMLYDHTLKRSIKEKKKKIIKKYNLY